NDSPLNNSPENSFLSLKKEAETDETTLKKYQNFTGSNHAAEGHWNDPPKQVFKRTNTESSLSSIQKPNGTSKTRKPQYVPAVDLSKPAAITPPSTNLIPTAKSINSIPKPNTAELSTKNDTTSSLPEAANKDENDKTCISISESDILGCFYNVLNFFSPSSPVEEKSISDTRKRIDILASRISSLPEPVVSNLGIIATSIMERQNDKASLVYIQINKVCFENEGRWLVGLKRVIDLAKKNPPQTTQ
ncbi:hypothetical protein AYI68_g3548, partial [Smittium mucronatum]